MASREGAGYAAFYQLEQQLPVSGRRRLLKQSGAFGVAVTEAETAAALWSLRMDVRVAFYRVVSAQIREGTLADGIRELEDIVRILRTREQEGEGSRYDRLRAERELAEQRSQRALVASEAAQARAALAGFLPAGAPIERVTGTLDTPFKPLARVELMRLALDHRSEYIAEKQQVERYRVETLAAKRLRYPEPILIAGLKRGEVLPGRSETASAIGLSVPLPIFNKGQTETARWRAEQDRAAARAESLERRIRADVAAAVSALEGRRAAAEQYRREVSQTNADLERIARTGYQEGEIGILELLDSYRIRRQSELRLVELQTLIKDAQIELDRAAGMEVLP